MTRLVVWGEALAGWVVRACRHRVTRPMVVLARVVSVVCLITMVLLAVLPLVILVGGWMLLNGSGSGVAGVLVLAVTFMILLVLDFALLMGLSIVRLAANSVGLVAFGGERIAGTIEQAMKHRGSAGG